MYATENSRLTNPIVINWYFIDDYWTLISNLILKVMLIEWLNDSINILTIKIMQAILIEWSTW